MPPKFYFDMKVKTLNLRFFDLSIKNTHQDSNLFSYPSGKLFKKHCPKKSESLVLTYKKIKFNETQPII